MSANGTCAMSKESALPLAFLARMAVLLDEEFPAFLAALSRPRRIGLRVNTLKVTTERFEALSPWPLAPVPWCPQGYLLPYDTNAGLYPLHDAGLYYIQEPSTMAVGTLLAPHPGERVLDLCAAPGGKSTHVASLLAGQGLLVSNEIDPKRAQVLQHNLDRWGARNIVVLNESPERLAAHWPGAFDRVLVDAPCSGEGMFRKNVEARYHWSEAHVRGCALRQRAILDSAARLVRPGGILAYATCTFAPEENEGVIARFLQQFPDFALEKPAWFPGFAAGHPEWSTWPPAKHDDLAESETGRSQALEAGLAALACTVRLWPHQLEGEGHFIAIMRHAGAEDRPPWPVAAADQLTSPQQACLTTFWREVMAMPLPDQLLLHQRGRDTMEVYALPPEGLDVSGLRALRPGRHLGTLRGGITVRFEPAHGLAMALSCDAVQRRLDEPLGSEVVACYLRGEALRVPGPDGWLLICVEGFPLGWGKRSGGIIKNHYPKALRRLQ